MEEKKLTELESISIIAEMISRTKERYIGDGNIMMMWGWLTVAVSSLVWSLLAATLNPAWNWLWFLLPAIGGTLTPIMAKKSESRQGVKTYSEREFGLHKSMIIQHIIFSDDDLDLPLKAGLKAGFLCVLF